MNWKMIFPVGWTGLRPAEKPSRWQDITAAAIPTPTILKREARVCLSCSQGLGTVCSGWEKDRRLRGSVGRLPGSPDLVLPGLAAVAFVHGCQWHWHGCSRCRMPKTNVEYWSGKVVKYIIPFNIPTDSAWGSGLEPRPRLKILPDSDNCATSRRQIAENPSFLPIPSRFCRPETISGDQSVCRRALSVRSPVSASSAPP